MSQLRANGRSCILGLECHSGVCSGGICVNGTNVSNKCQSNNSNNNDGIPWWGWILIVIGILIVIAAIIWLIHKATFGSSYSEPSDNPNQATITKYVPVVDE